MMVRWLVVGKWLVIVKKDLSFHADCSIITIKLKVSLLLSCVYQYVGVMVYWNWLETDDNQLSTFTTISESIQKSDNATRLFLVYTCSPDT